jgi:hypothetical protein
VFPLRVAEALEERGGPLDVGEEEGDRPGRQAGQERPPWNQDEPLAITGDVRRGWLPLLGRRGYQDGVVKFGEQGADDSY